MARKTCTELSPIAQADVEAQTYLVHLLLDLVEVLVVQVIVTGLNKGCIVPTNWLSL